jgi:hypothetical protein|tara:strand:+ start:766 stop:870 length:105 start_codon:yes stop_codon:yes gene_type:complete
VYDPRPDKGLLTEADGTAFHKELPQPPTDESLPL